MHFTGNLIKIMFVLTCFFLLMISADRSDAEEPDSITIRLQGLTMTTDVGLRNEHGYVLGRPPLTLVSLVFSSSNHPILLNKLLIEKAVDCQGKDLIPPQGGRMSPMHAERDTQGTSILYNVIHLAPLTQGCSKIAELSGMAEFTQVLKTKTYKSAPFAPKENSPIAIQGIGSGWHIKEVAESAQKVWTKNRKYEQFALTFDLEVAEISLEEKNAIQEFQFLDTQGKELTHQQGSSRWSHGKGKYRIHILEEQKRLVLVVKTLQGRDTVLPFTLQHISAEKLGKFLTNTAKP